MNAENPKQFYSNLFFSLSFSSLLLCPDNVSNVYEDDSIVKIITKGNRKKEIKPDELLYFDKEETGAFDVIDFFDTRECTPHDFLEIRDNTSEFVKKINFMGTPRAYNKKTKDIFALSRLDADEVLDPDYSQGISRLKVLRMMKDAGITGKYNNTINGKNYFKKPLIEFHKRIRTPIVESYMDFDKVYKMKQEEGEAWSLIEKLRSR